MVRSYPCERGREQSLWLHTPHCNLPLLGLETDRVIIGLAPEIPEDLYMLIKKVCQQCDSSIEHLLIGIQAVSVRKHLERNRKDKDGKFRLILIESRIHRLSRYYKTVGALPPTWKYESATASTLVA